MNTITKKFVTAIATGAVLTNALLPMAFAETTISISGNGAFSDNDANVAKTNNTAVVQNNSAIVTNHVEADANTGKNDANFNTGGDVAIKTGNATTDVTIENTLNKNIAEVDVCDCDGDLKVAITGNGAYSDNDANVAQTNATALFQTNFADVHNYVDADANTGKNDADFNTGDTVTILTGNASTSVDLDTKANANWAQVGGGDGDGGTVEAIISGNGAFSDNDLNLALTNSVSLVQSNLAIVSNWVDADANTGKNDANFNTGGDVAIKTGNAKTWVEVDNTLNFNAADVDACCFDDIKASVSGNGADSYNTLNAAFVDYLSAFQDNFDLTDNWLDADAKTGKNDAEFNTGEADADPFIWTGDATTHESVNNTSNANVFGPGFDWELPGGQNVDFSFDLGGLFWSLFHIA